MALTMGNGGKLKFPAWLDTCILWFMKLRLSPVIIAFLNDRCRKKDVAQSHSVEASPNARQEYEKTTPKGGVIF